jgi:glycosyltransferase involved in cell wall biosynthesis
MTHGKNYNKMKKVPLTVILMAYNEEKTIENEVKNYYEKIIEKLPGSEMIIAEDGSKDKTRDVLNRLAHKIDIIPLPPSSKKGYAASLRTALEMAKGELIFYADSGLKHDPDDFWKLYKEIKKYDLVSGYKYKRSDQYYRKVLAWGLNKIIALYFGPSFKDIDCGFKLFNTKVKKMLLSKEWLLKNNISMELCLRVDAANFKYHEIPVEHFGRKDGPSRGLPPKKIPRAIINILQTMPNLKKEIYKNI